MSVAQQPYAISNKYGVPKTTTAQLTLCVMVISRSLTKGIIPKATKRKSAIRPDPRANMARANFKMALSRKSARVAAYTAPLLICVINVKISSIGMVNSKGGGTRVPSANRYGAAKQKPAPTSDTGRPIRARIRALACPALEASCNSTVPKPKAHPDYKSISNRRGSSSASFTRTRNVTAPLPSTMR